MITPGWPSYRANKTYNPTVMNPNCPASEPIVSKTPTRLQSYDMDTPVGKLHVWHQPTFTQSTGNPLTSGRPVMLLVHGWGGWAEAMGELVEKLAPSFPDWSFVAITLPEISKSSGKGPTPHHFSQQSVTQVRQTIDYLSRQPGQPQLYVLGYSLGAPITVHALAQLQTQTRQKPTKLLLLAPAFDFSPSLNKTLLDQDHQPDSGFPLAWMDWNHNDQLRPYLRESVDLLRRGLNPIDRCIFISPNDTAVSLPAVQQSLRQRSELSLISSGSHESIDNPELVQNMTQWLQNQAVKPV